MLGQRRRICWAVRESTNIQCEECSVNKFYVFLL